MTTSKSSLTIQDPRFITGLCNNHLEYVIEHIRKDGTHSTFSLCMSKSSNRKCELWYDYTQESLSESEMVKIAQQLKKEKEWQKIKGIIVIREDRHIFLEERSFQK